MVRIHLVEVAWDYVCVLWRGEDDLTVAQWKNDESTNNLMREIGFKVANTYREQEKHLILSIHSQQNLLEHIRTTVQNMEQVQLHHIAIRFVNRQ